MTHNELVFITPHLPGAGLPTRPDALLRGLSESGRFERVRVVNRLRPAEFLRRVLSARSLPGSWLALDQDLPGGTVLVSHPWPFGTFEDAALASIAEIGRATGGTVVWLCDPKSAGMLRRLPRRRPLATVFDAYDAWDLSPLVRGKRRREAVRHGYAIAATAADLVFANTRAMADRLRDLGAKNVRRLPNGSPPVEPMVPAAEPYLAYVGRVHERFETRLVAAAASANPAATFRIAGPVERVPDGWSDLLAVPNVVHLGALDAKAARRLIGGSRGLLVPHHADDYTRSQDAMKAWDALSVGAAVVSTSVPPADEWTAPVALVADDPGAFAEACRRVLEGELDPGRDDRLALAAQNGWDRRVGVALEAIAEVTGA
jgi:glycosyltransferase involved in cell wall biosynthesis